MIDENITTLSFDNLPPDDASAWEAVHEVTVERSEQFDSMTDEDENAADALDNPTLTEAELNQFKRTFWAS